MTLEAKHYTPPVRYDMPNIIYELSILLGASVYFIAKLKLLVHSAAERGASFQRISRLSSLDLPADRFRIWVYAVSVGEVNASSVIIKEIKRLRPDVSIILSTATAMGLATAREKVHEADAIVIHRLDLRYLVESMFAAIKPSAIVLVEGDLWFNMLTIATKSHIPVFLANGKISSSSVAQYRRLSFLRKAIVECFTYAYVQADVYKQRFCSLGMRDEQCEVIGNVKLDVNVRAPSEEDRTELAQRISCYGAHPIVVFGSLHPGEEICAIQAMSEVWKEHPSAIVLIIPRHIERSGSIIESIRAISDEECRIYDGLPHQLSNGNARIIIVAQIGLLQQLYALCDVAVVCGTFVKHVGGHNLAEPSFYGKPVVYGPSVEKQPVLHDLILHHKAGIQTPPEALPDVLLDLLGNPEKARAIGMNGESMISQSRGVVSRLVIDLLSRLDLPTASPE